MFSQFGKNSVVYFLRLILNFSSLKFEQIKYLFTNWMDEVEECIRYVVRSSVPLKLKETFTK